MGWRGSFPRRSGMTHSSPVWRQLAGGHPRSQVSVFLSVMSTTDRWLRTTEDVGLAVDFIWKILPFAQGDRLLSLQPTLTAALALSRNDTSHPNRSMAETLSYDCGRLEQRGHCNEASKPRAPHTILGGDTRGGAFKTMQGPTSKVMPNPDLQVRYLLLILCVFMPN